MRGRLFPRFALPVVVGAMLLGALFAAWAEPDVRAPVRTGEIAALAYNVAGPPEPLSSSQPVTNSLLISPLLNDYGLVLLQEDWAGGQPLSDHDALAVSFRWIATGGV